MAASAILGSGAIGEAHFHHGTAYGVTQRAYAYKRSHLVALRIGRFPRVTRLRYGGRGSGEARRSMELHRGTARSSMGSLRTSSGRVANTAGDEFTSAFGSIPDVVGIAGGLARSRMTHMGH